MVLLRTGHFEVIKENYISHDMTHLKHQHSLWLTSILLYITHVTFSTASQYVHMTLLLMIVDGSKNMLI